LENIVFDHSWAEVDRKPFDVAITLPLSNQGLPPGISPVFSGIDTTTGKPTIVEYGTFSNVGEFAAAEHIRSISFIDYVDQFPGPPDFLTLLRNVSKPYVELKSKWQFEQSFSACEWKICTK